MNETIVDLEANIRRLKRKLSKARRDAAPEPVGDYTFKQNDGSTVTLSKLFGDRRDLIVVHNMGSGCSYCTLWADGFNGQRRHLEDRAAFVVCSPDEPDVQQRFAQSRGWAFTMVSAAVTTFFKDMGFSADDGSPWPGVSAFHKTEQGAIERTGRASFGPDDDFCPVWPLFDLLTQGAHGWEPREDKH